MATYEMVKNSSVFFRGPYMHEARKKFKTIGEAIKGACESSYSLAQSDIYILKGVSNFSEAYSIIDEYYEENEDSWNLPAIGCLYTYDNPVTSMVENSSNDGLEPNSLYYQTSTGKNQILIRKEEDKEGNIFYTAIYRVESSNLLPLSTAMKSFSDNGWDCRCIVCEKEMENGKTIIEMPPSEESLRAMDEQAVEEQKERDEEAISKMIERGAIPGLEFSVNFGGIDSEFPSVYSSYISNNPEEIKGLIERKPEISGKVLRIVANKIEELKKLEIPTSYEYNEEFYDGSDYYIKRRDGVVESLEKVYEDIKEKVYVKDEEEGLWIDADKQLETTKKITDASWEWIGTIKNPEVLADVIYNNDLYYFYDWHEKCDEATLKSAIEMHPEILELINKGDKEKWAISLVERRLKEQELAKLKKENADLDVIIEKAEELDEKQNGKSKKNDEDDSNEEK